MSPHSPHMPPIIEIENLTYTFAGRDVPALRDVTLCLHPGEFLVITGPSGCGKSTLALAMGGYLFQQHVGAVEGAVRIGGMDAMETPIYDLTEVVGVVQQNPESQFCTLRVEDEIAFGLENHRLPRDEIAERMAWALDVVDAAHLRGRELATLSGGEKQRVAVASVLVTQPRVLVLDEPTSNLDPKGTAAVLAVLDRIRARTDMAVVVIEHKLRALSSFAPRLIRMADGRVTDDGPLVLPPLPYERPGERALTRSPDLKTGPSEVVRADDLTVSYGEAPVLKDLSLKIRSGEFVAIMGDNGSGKTTFLQSVMGLIKPQGGRVITLDRDTRETAISDLARDVALVFQNPDHQLFAESVWEEAIFAPRNFNCLDEPTERRTCSLLERAGLSGRFGDHPYRLSYGEKRRLNLISVLGYAPRLILLDEILIGQDPDNIAFLMSQLWDAVERGATVMMVNHNAEVTAHYATRVLFLEGGSVAVDAPPGAAFCRLRAQGRAEYCPPEQDSGSRTAGDPTREVRCETASRL